MSAKINITGFILKDFRTGQRQVEERFTKNGKKVAKGKIAWSHGKDESDNKQYSDIKFAAFGEAGEFIMANKDEFISFEGYLQKVTFQDKVDQTRWVSYYEVMVSEAKKFSKQEPVKSPHEVEDDMVLDDEGMPF